jgi:long-chain acyl-CoA synthetase
VPHPTLGQVVAAVLTDPDDAAPARDRAGRALSPVQRPRLWFHLDALPMTPAGKLDRQAVCDEVTAQNRRRLVPTTTARS